MLAENLDLNRSNLWWAELEVEFCPQGSSRSACEGQEGLEFPASIHEPVSAPGCGGQSIGLRRNYVHSGAAGSRRRALCESPGKPTSRKSRLSTARRGNFNPLAATCGRITVAVSGTDRGPGNSIRMRFTPRGDFLCIGWCITHIRKSACEREQLARDKQCHEREPDGRARRERARRRLLCEPRDWIPTLVANYIPAESWYTLQSENGLLGMGPFPRAIGRSTPDLINAGKTVTLFPGAATFSSADSFAMIRGGTLTLRFWARCRCQRAATWQIGLIPGKACESMGGREWIWSQGAARDVLMEHTTPDGSAKCAQLHAASDWAGVVERVDHRSLRTQCHCLRLE